jgi:hypothetical protein
MINLNSLVSTILRKVIRQANISFLYYSSKVGEPNNEVIPSKEFIYQL